jgi:ATP-dependent Lon protease
MKTNNSTVLLKNKNEKIVVTVNDDIMKKEKMANDKKDDNSNFKLQIKHLKEMIERTILAHHQYKIIDILSSNDVNLSIQYLEKIYRNLEGIENDMCSKPVIETKDDINLIIGELSSIFRNYGTQCIHDLLEVTFGNHYKKCALLETNTTTTTVTTNVQPPDWDNDKFAVLKMHFRPINFKMLTWKNDKKSATSDKLIQKNKIVEDFVIVEKSANLDCFDMARTNKNFASRVFGIKVAVHNYAEQKTIIIGGMVDNVFLDCTSFDYITNKISSLWKNVPKDPEFMAESFTKFMKSLTLKDVLVFSNDEIYSKYLSNVSFIQSIKQKQTSQLIKEFMNTDLYSQRSMLIQLLLKSHEHEFKYLSYMLYDMLSNEINPQVESNEQTVLFNSLPWNIKLYFKDAMKQTVSYTNTISKYENGNMTFEQQICLLKTTDAIKEKAMVKLREIKSKSDDTTTKARQYLEGLLKIPFGIYSREYIMEEMKTIKDIYSKMCVKNEMQELLCNENVSQNDVTNCADAGEDKTVLEIKNACIQINNNIENIRTICIDNFITAILDNNRKKNTLITILNKLTTFVKKHKLQNQMVNNNSDMVIGASNKTIQSIKSTIELYIKNIYKAASTASTELAIAAAAALHEHADELFKELIVEYNLDCKSPLSVIRDLRNDTNRMTGIMENVGNYVENVRNTLDNAVHGHTSAKRQVERIIGQWVSGESTGYCFGFEGPPGVGKTSLAKYGLAKCLTNENGESRPFAFIAMGGSSNGSTIEGHNYTYVGSMWGKIVDILMDKKCMNPIIFIDELDKISNTDHGREIVGILTHLIDSTQNDCFQDKYFSGIDLDLSKALFIFSYNNPEAVDKILLDRIHRIKFKHITLDEKLIICKDYLLPEMYKKMGLENNVVLFTEDNLKFIIEKYTCEPGVRKLKELLFEIIGEINLQHIKNKSCIQELPITITNDDIKLKYFRERHEVRVQKIPPVSRAGVINGLWANAAGQGGIIPIEAHFFPCDRFFDLKLTGMQGDVMKESMNVAKTLAWSLLSENEIAANLESFSKTKMQGIHVHCPEGATPKDGPSAGTAITCVLYSILTNKKINHKIAITGEINLQGNVTAIGGLDLKIMGGINGGVTTFIFPKDNIKDFNDFMDKNGSKNEVKSIVFIPVSSIHEVLGIIFC